jgi:hypothetical protein
MDFTFASMGFSSKQGFCANLRMNPCPSARPGVASASGSRCGRSVSEARPACAREGRSPLSPSGSKTGVWTGAQRRPFASPDTGSKRLVWGSRRSVSIAPPKAGRGTDCPRRGVPNSRQTCYRNFASDLLITDSQRRRLRSRKYSASDRRPNGARRKAARSSAGETERGRCWPMRQILIVRNRSNIQTEQRAGTGIVVPSRESADIGIGDTCGVIVRFQ